MAAWKEAASLILAARHTQKSIRSPCSNYDYNLLWLKRHQNSKFMPNAYVFPGGAIDPSDADLKWHSLFFSFGFNENSFKSLSPNTSARPSIFKSKANELPRDVSLRISAIRETFEECGILICRQLQKTTNDIGWANYIQISKNELQNWQTRVHNDAREFYRLCENFNCYPDLWSLHEWSNWLTPTFIPGKRFDTAFYLACISATPSTICETTEIQDLKWCEPANFLVPSPDVVLPPPQRYEITRIAKFESIDGLLDFAIDRTKAGVILNVPVLIELRDGVMHLLPGDSMYPKEVSLVEKQIIDRTDITLREFQDMSPVKNRLEIFDRQVKKIYAQYLDSADVQTREL
ncbi:acyl-coenzyme A diphosphatase NUDT19 [Xylocopa sonorina]|uniref:acyl-coenzyme A diphosphatase NUDT19 n=1 Tax=Xylocopa sonorina TaxID=1818115 RepID=UPI00403B1FF2